MESVRESPSVVRAGVSWSSVFAGTFVFLAIETTFGMLASAIFPSTSAGSSLNVGPGIWIIVLSIIALYFGAKTAAHFSSEARRLNAMYYGLITFGLSVFSLILIVCMVVGSAGNSARVLDGLAANAGWLFVSLLLGGIAAAIGGAFSVSRRPVLAANPERVTLQPAA